MPAVESKKRNSILGALALLLALPAVALNYLDFPGIPDVMVGPIQMRFATAVTASIATLAFLSLMLAGRSRRTGTELPLAALLVAGAAFGIGYFRHRAATPAPVPTANVAAPAPPPIAKPLPAPPPQAKKSAPPNPPNTSNITAQTKSAVNTATGASLRQRNLTLLREAEAQFDQAKTKVLESLETDPAYVAAKAESDSTLEALKRARAAYPPGAPALVTASQNALAAHDKLQVIIDSAFEKDAAAREAKANLEAAKASMRQ